MTVRKLPSAAQVHDLSALGAMVHPICLAHLRKLDTTKFLELRGSIKHVHELQLRASAAHRRPHPDRAHSASLKNTHDGVEIQEPLLLARRHRNG